MTTNIATKQLNSVVKILGELAYEDIFVYETPNENWIELKIQNDEITNSQVAEMFPTNFRVEFAEYDDALMFARNIKIS